ncbi:uncharacterized protein (DUF1330 family) [Panacagrimonas perspica]|uniref:Uncharacterized protein (DUF1330 family) n=2 Tax=Panacagrimonas perspica TaxID=381431 RepID=A0A4R7PDC8_9GAMM|nr:uncharacterized protein (DUF1330 family) [Panacagrimonas perspica]THD03333.1 hypothetical protein B1810_10690 [Panacagrimonas perspica]
MAAYFIGFAKVQDAGKAQEYSAKAGPTIGPAGGSVVGRGKLAEVLAGAVDAHSCLIVKFASVDAAKAWYNSPAYQALIPLRDEAIHSTFVLIEEPN